MEDLKISKELIKAVLQKETEILSKDFNFTINEDYIEFSDDGEMQFEYCIYKFAFKCKEWAWNNFRLNIFIEKHTFDLYEASVKVCSFNSGFGSYNSFIDCYRREDTEIKAIIKVCEWILKNKDNNDLSNIQGKIARFKRKIWTLFLVIRNSK